MSLVQDPPEIGRLHFVPGPSDLPFNDSGLDWSLNASLLGAALPHVPSLSAEIGDLGSSIPVRRSKKRVQTVIAL